MVPSMPEQLVFTVVIARITFSALCLGVAAYQVRKIFAATGRRQMDEDNQAEFHFWGIRVSARGLRPVWISVAALWAFPAYYSLPEVPRKVVRDGNSVEIVPNRAPAVQPREVEVPMTPPEAEAAQQVGHTLAQTFKEASQGKGSVTPASESRAKVERSIRTETQAGGPVVVEESKTPDGQTVKTTYAPSFDPELGKLRFQPQKVSLPNAVVKLPGSVAPLRSEEKRDAGR